MASRIAAAISFRPRLPTDDRYIQTLSRGAFAEYANNGARAVRALILEDRAHTELAWLDDEPVGFVVVSFDRARTAAGPMGRTRVAHLSAIATDPLLRRRGIGRRLLDRAEAIALEHRAVCLSLTTGVDNTRARALFNSAGYLSLAGVSDFYQSGQDAVFMHKTL